MKISVAIITLNAARDLDRCLASVAFADQIVVLEQGDDLGILAGRILDGETGLPLAGVTATLEGPLNDTRTTAADGVFHFQALPAGDYTLTLALADYTALTTSTSIWRARSVEVPSW